MEMTLLKIFSLVNTMLLENEVGVLLVDMVDRFRLAKTATWMMPVKSVFIRLRVVGR